MYTQAEHRTEGSVKSFITKVYAWMACALSITAAVAYYIFGNPALFAKIFSSSLTVFMIILGQFILVLALSLFIMRMSYATAIIAFLLYAVSMGVTVSAIFYTYTIASIYITFLVTSGMFGAMALYGYFTKADLRAVGTFALMGLFGLIIGLFVNLFFKSPMVDLMLSLIGIVIFTLLTAYDMQRIVRLGQVLSGGGLQDKFAIIGALTLYLDFVNLFLMLLRFTGRQRE